MMQLAQLNVNTPSSATEHMIVLATAHPAKFASGTPPLAGEQHT